MLNVKIFLTLNKTLVVVMSPIKWMGDSDNMGVSEYKTYLREHGRKERTIRNVEKQLTSILGFLRANGYNYEPERITERDVRFFIDNARNKESTKKVYANTLDNYIRFHTGRRLVRDMDILWNRTEYRRTFISRDELIATYRFAEPRARLAIVMGAFMGIRTVEMERMTWDDIHQDHITLYGKGHGIGFVQDQPMSILVLEELKMRTCLSDI